MASAATGAPRPGVSVGPTSEFSLFFHVKPGHGDALREALRTLHPLDALHPLFRQVGSEDVIARAVAAALEAAAEEAASLSR